MGGSDRAVFTRTICGDQAKPQKHADDPKTSRTRKEKKKFTHQLADWEHGERPQGRVIATPCPEVDGAPRPGGRVFPREEVLQQP
jgi:hypothetical protein